LDFFHQRGKAGIYILHAAFATPMPKIVQNSSTPVSNEAAVFYRGHLAQTVSHGDLWNNYVLRRGQQGLDGSSRRNDIGAAGSGAKSAVRSYPLLGEDAQMWASRIRREGDEDRGSEEVLIVLGKRKHPRQQIA
jgi:hypothetical protein